MYLCIIIALIILVVIAVDIYNKNKSGFCLYDKPLYYPDYKGLKAKIYNIKMLRTYNKLNVF